MFHLNKLKKEEFYKNQNAISSHCNYKDSILVFRFKGKYKFDILLTFDSRLSCYSLKTLFYFCHLQYCKVPDNPNIP